MPFLYTKPRNRVIMRYTLTVFLFLGALVLQSSHAQAPKITPGAGMDAVEVNSASKSLPISTSLLKEINHQVTGDKWAVSVRNITSRKHYTEKVEQIKQAKAALKRSSMLPVPESEKGGRAVNPVIGTDFEANWSTESTPPDNTMAISNGGFIITANNDGIEYYNGSGTFLYFDFWSDFFNDNSLTASIYDPKVIYDSGADRFVLVLLHGSNANTTKVIVSFSKSNNPQDGWWTYTLTGNPLNNNCWFDYPALGVSNNEIYITGNLFAGNSFNQSVIYQIPKAAGYAGQSLDWQYWSGLTSTAFDAFSLVPASFGHQGNYGPGMYFVSNESSGDNEIILWDLTDDMSGTPALNSFAISTTAYSPAANAFQAGTSDQLDNGDCRIQSAFYLNGILHFVFHSDIGEGWNGINYNRLYVSDLEIASDMFGLQGSYDYAYPAVASFSKTANSPNVMIAFLRSSEDTYPQVRVVNCDQDFTWSPSVLVREGENFVDFLSDEVERWGDYTGISRRHNSADPRIWLAGCYGSDISSQGAFNTYKTWVAEVSGGSVVSTDETSMGKDVRVFPNPVYDLIQVVFTMTEREPIQIELLDADGRLVKLLYRDAPKTGENRLTFNKGVLAPGTYILSIRSNTQILHNEKLVIVD
jgi:Secretion system C-terminal sorting domain